MKERIHSIDIVRGLIMIIMTLDHTRDFFHFPGGSPLNMQTTTVVLFFTRWITHFCAPTFVFLSGVSVYLAGQRRTVGQLTSFLLKRGAWLILSDLLIISLLFTFDLQYHFLIFRGAVWNRFWHDPVSAAYPHEYQNNRGYCADHYVWP